MLMVLCLSHPNRPSVGLRRCSAAC